MRIKVKTAIQRNYLEVFECFDKEMLKYLTDQRQVKIINIDGSGSNVGDRVDLLILKPMKGRWVSKIIGREISDQRASFKDVGEILPFGIKTWEHNHIIEKIDENNSYIIDEIRYTTKLFFVAWFMYVPFWMNFRARKNKYRSYLLEEKN